jgi:hypothetical protein
LTPVDRTLKAELYSDLAMIAANKRPRTLCGLLIFQQKYRRLRRPPTALICSSWVKSVGPSPKAPWGSKSVQLPAFSRCGRSSCGRRRCITFATIDAAPENAQFSLPADCALEPTRAFTHQQQPYAPADGVNEPVIHTD